MLLSVSMIFIICCCYCTMSNVCLCYAVYAISCSMNKLSPPPTSVTYAHSEQTKPIYHFFSSANHHSMQRNIGMLRHSQSQKYVWNTFWEQALCQGPYAIPANSSYVVNAPIHKTGRKYVFGNSLTWKDHLCEAMKAFDAIHSEEIDTVTVLDFVRSRREYH